MPRPHREIPSQRLARSSSSVAATSKPRRSVLWALGITVLGWILLAYPGAILALLSYLFVAGSTANPATPESVMFGLSGMVFVLCMAAFPLCTGLAVTWRRRAWWTWAVVSGVMSAVAVVYVVVNWIVPIS